MITRFTLAIMAVALLASGGAAAGPSNGDCDPRSDVIIQWAFSGGNDCSGPDPSECRIWESSGGAPGASLHPTLGILYLDPDGCVRDIAKAVIGIAYDPDDP